MREVVEHYGLGVLEIISASLIYGIIFKGYSAGSVLYQMLTNYFITLCGVG